MKRLAAAAFLSSMVIIAGVFIAEARPEYARQENKTCGYCHLNPAGGGARGYRGMYYGANSLSFCSYDEEREAKIAGVDPNGDARATQAKIRYVGNIGGPAANQIQLASLRTPVLAVFVDTADDNGKLAAKVLHKIAAAYGQSVTVVGVASGDAKKALALTSELGSQIRILADTDGKAAKKFTVTNALDIVVVSPRGDTSKTIPGFSNGSLTTAMPQIGNYEVAAPEVDLSEAPATTTRGGRIGG